MKTTRNIPRFFLRIVYLALIGTGIFLLISGDLRPAPELDFDAYLNPTITPADNFVLRGTSWDYTLGTDPDGYSQIDVRETIDAVFTDESDAVGIERYLPATFDNHSTNLKLTAVTEDGVDADYTMKRVKDLWHIVTTGPQRLTGDHIYVITYSMTQVTDTVGPTVGNRDDDPLPYPELRDRFYWNISGEQWLQPSAHADVTIHMSPTLAESILPIDPPHAGWAWAFLGDDEDLKRSTDASGNVVFTGTIDATMPAYTVVYAEFDFEPGVFRPSPPTPIDYFAIVAPFIPVAFGIFLLILALVTRATAWRNARGRGVIVAESEPQEDVDLLLASRILGRSRRGLPAALLDLVVRKNLRLIRVGGSSADASPTGHYEFELLSTHGLNGDEQQLVKVLFGRSKRPVRIAANGGILRPALQRVSFRAWLRSIREGYRRVPSGLLRDLLSWGSLASTSLQWGFSHQLAFHSTPAQVWILFWVAVASALITFTAFTIGVTTYPLTSKGALAREHLLGIREYIRVAEQKRIQFLQSPSGVEVSGAEVTGAEVTGAEDVQVAKINDPLLPYAMLFNQERGWRRTLDLWAAGAMPTGWWGGS